jgi:adenosylcobinamide kinase/adenosylcobinamide-phosphate guanylyltransferase
MLQQLSLVLGGAASGKSAFAESLVRQTGRPRTYLATAQAFDSEMRDKITAHRLARGDGWRTVEEALDLAAVLAAQDRDGIVLLDCATLWLTNVMLAEQDIATAAAGLMTALAACPAPVVVVTNDVGGGIVPDSTLGRAFRTAQGRLNQDLASVAGLVVLVTAGLPLVLKGTLPQ